MKKEAKLAARRANAHMMLPGAGAMSIDIDADMSASSAKLVRSLVTSDEYLLTL